MGQFVVSAWAASSSFSSSYTADNLGDGRFANAADEIWLSSTGSAHWARADLGTSKVATWYRITPRQASQFPVAWTLEGSDDASSWTTVDTRSGQSFSTVTTRTFAFSNSTAYRYYRLNISDPASGSYVSMAEFEIGDDDPPAAIWEHRGNVLNNSGNFTLGLVFVVNSDIEVTHLSAFVGSATATWTVRIRDDAGSVVTSATYSASSSETGWRELAITPVTLAPGTYQVEQYAGGARYIYWGGSHSSAVNYGPGNEVTVPANGTVTYRSSTDVSRRSSSGDAEATIALAGESTVGFKFVPTASTPAFVAPAPSGASFEPVGNAVWLAEFAAPAPSGATFAPVEPEPVPTFSARARSNATFDPIGSANVTYPPTTVYFTAPAPSRSLMVPALQPQAPPAIITSWPVTVESHTMPALSEAQRTVSKFADYQPLVGSAGRFQIWVDGQPITYLRDVPTIVEDYSSSDPLGDDGARFVCKQIHPWDELGTGDLSMFDMHSDPPVDIAFEDELGNLTHLWDGFLASHGDDTTSTDEARTFTAEGTLKQGAHWPWTPPAYMEPTDPGVVFARAMNSVPNRRYAAFVEVETGLPPITYRGSQNQSILDYALEVLSKMTASDGRQWTTVKVGPRNYQLALNPTLDTYDAAIVKGAEGVDVRLVEDEVTRVDGYFGQGIAPNGGQWGNFFFPGLDLFIPPPYPYNDTTETIYIGDTDAGTDTGDGVTVAQRRLVELGYAVAVDGTFNSADAAAVTQMQRDFGLLVDGRIGPQTWSSLFSPGVNEVDLGRIRLPLVSKPWVMEHLYAANGAEIGTNPAWDNKPIPHMPNINFGSDITKAEATVLARKMLEQNGEAAWTGPIDLLTDLVAPDGVTPISRLLVREGWRIKVIGHDGDVIVRVGKASKDDLRVSLSVDEKARDALTLDAIAARDRHALRETKPRPGNPQKISALIRDHVTQYEDESKAGKIPAYPVNGNVGLWSVFPIFVSQTGFIAKFELSANNVKTTFSVAIFGKPIQPQVLAGYVPDPIADGSGWRDHYQTLVLDHGLCAIYGEPGALGGYAPRVQADGGPITGDLFDDSGFPFESAVGGYLWVAVFASASTIVSGRAFPGVPL